jgi:hypothetical protein
MKKAFLLLLVCMLLAPGCSHLGKIRNITMWNEFEKNVRAYLQLVRWHELETAATTFSSPDILPEYRKRISDAEQIRITDYRIIEMECKPETGEGVARVEFEYYRPPSIRVQRVRDVQRWKYEGIVGEGSWRLQTVLPLFHPPGPTSETASPP